MSNIAIYIPSAYREDRQYTLKNLPIKWLRKTFLVVQNDNLSSYTANYGKLVRILACPLKGIAPTRQWIMENAKEDHIIMISDDLNFSKRTDSGKLVKCDDEDTNDMLELLETWLIEGLVHVGVSQRAGNNNVEEEYIENTRMNDLYGYNRKIFLNSGVRWDRLPVMEDFDVTLSLLRLGYSNRVTYKYAWGQRKSGDSGGCSTYRTAKMQHESAAQLAKYHTGFVTIIRNKESKTTWENIGNERTDVVINWKAAYESFQASKRKPSKGFFK